MIYLQTDGLKRLPCAVVSGLTSIDGSKGIINLQHPLTCKRYYMSDAQSVGEPAMRPQVQPQPQPYVTPQPQQPGPSQPKKGLPMIPIAIIAVAIIAVVIVVLYATGVKGSNNQLLTMLSAPANQTPQRVFAIVAQKVQSSSELNVSYAGRARISISGSSGINLSGNIPMELNFQKLGNNTRFSFNATGIPLFGNVTGVSINLANGTTYSCSESSHGSPFSSSSGYGASAPAGISCERSSTVDTAVSEQLNSFTQFDNLYQNKGANGTRFRVIGQSSYKNQGCVLLALNGSVNQSGVTGSYSLGMCLSDQYNVPLELSFVERANQPQGTQGLYLNFTLNETSIGNPVALPGLSSLPGPIVNSTSPYSNYSGTGISTITTIPYTGSSTSSYSGNFTCTPISSEFNCSTAANPVYEGTVYYYNNGVSGSLNGTFINLWLSQDTGHYWTNVTVAFVPSGTSVSGGIPQIQFDKNDSSSLGFEGIPSKVSYSDALVVNLPVTKSTSGSFQGSIWAKYLKSGTSGWQYTEMAMINGSTSPSQSFQTAKSTTLPVTTVLQTTVANGPGYYLVTLYMVPSSNATSAGAACFQVSSQYGSICAGAVGAGGNGESSVSVSVPSGAQITWLCSNLPGFSSWSGAGVQGGTSACPRALADPIGVTSNLSIYANYIPS